MRVARPASGGHPWLVESPIESPSPEIAPEQLGGTPAPPDRLPAGSRLVRVVCAVVGTIALAIGIVGIVLPLLPTTPFLLLAAACYARASTRLYGWLLGQPALGPIVADWRRSRSLPPGVRTRALAAVALTFAVSIALVDDALVRAGLAAIAVVLAVFLVRIPTSS